MKKLIVTALITLVLFVSVTSQASAYPASLPETGRAARPFITTNLRTLKTQVLAELPSQMRDYMLWMRLSSTVPAIAVKIAIPVTGAYGPESFKAFKELQADYFSGK